MRASGIRGGRLLGIHERNSTGRLTSVGEADARNPKNNFKKEKEKRHVNTRTRPDETLKNFIKELQDYCTHFSNLGSFVFCLSTISS